ncbi:hypothetical protein [Anabaena sp. WFMT]
MRNTDRKSDISSKGKSPDSQDPNLWRHLPISLVFAYGIGGQEMNI